MTNNHGKDEDYHDYIMFLVLYVQVRAQVAHIKVILPLNTVNAVIQARAWFQFTIVIDRDVCDL